MGRDRHYLGHRKRLRERFRKKGRAALEDYELLELLLGYALPRRDTKPIAKALLERSKSLRRVMDEPVDELEASEGVGEYASTLIKLVKACMSRCLEPGEADRAEVLDNPEKVVNFLRAEIGGEASEHFLLLCLDPSGRLIHTEHLARGTVNMAHVYPREVFRTALIKGASAVILVHNHPSGNLTPSSHDERLTKTLSELGEGLCITVHDHIIVTRDSAYSLKLGREIIAGRTDTTI
jgi:DNA repair protein RadC